MRLVMHVLATLVLASATVFVLALLAWGGHEVLHEHRARPSVFRVPKIVVVELQAANCDVVRRDIDVAHQRITDLHEALNSVSKTQPYRDKTPFVPTRKRPTYE